MRIGTAAAILASLCASAAAQESSVIPGTNCPNFPADSWWHADVSGLPVHEKSYVWMQHMSPTRKLHPDFGPSFGAQPVPYGIPITIVDGSHRKVRVTFTYAAESDNFPYPLGKDTRVEGGQYQTGDRHTVIVDRSVCRLYETFATEPRDGRWYAGSGATWDLRSNRLRPDGWTSADAAGLPILPGLLRYDEVARRDVDHAIRFTTNITNRAHIWPARHDAGSVSDATYPPMGARFRLKASFRIPQGVRPDTRAVLIAMKRFGLVLADNGSPWFFQGTADNRWSPAMIEQLKQVPASAFEAVDSGRLVVSRNSMQVQPAP